MLIGSAVCAFISAFFWFRSSTTAPPMTYEGIERFGAWLEQTARNNKWAAAFAGLAAVLAGIAIIPPPPAGASGGTSGSGGSTTSFLSLVVAILAVFFGPLVARANLKQQLAVTGREAWMREFREQVAALLADRQTIRTRGPPSDLDGERRQMDLIYSMRRPYHAIILLIAEREHSEFIQTLKDIMSTQGTDSEQYVREQKFTTAAADLLRRERAAIAADPGMWRISRDSLGL